MTVDPQQPVPTATVPVVSAWSSKINWTQVVGAAAMILTLLTGNRVSLSADQQAAIITVIGLIQGLVTWVLKTWFTAHVTAASLPNGLQPKETTK